MGYLSYSKLSPIECIKVSPCSKDDSSWMSEGTVTQLWLLILSTGLFFWFEVYLLLLISLEFLVTRPVFALGLFGILPWFSKSLIICPISFLGPYFCLDSGYSPASVSSTELLPNSSLVESIFSNYGSSVWLCFSTPYAPASKCYSLFLFGFSSFRLIAARRSWLGFEAIRRCKLVIYSLLVLFCLSWALMYLGSTSRYFWISS